MLRVEPDQWRVAAARQTYDEPRTFTTDEARRASLDFIHDLRAALRGRVDLLDYLGDDRARTAVLAGRN
jgi:hypothetical protein